MDTKDDSNQHIQEQMNLSRRNFLKNSGSVLAATLVGARMSDLGDLEVTEVDTQDMGYLEGRLRRRAIPRAIHVKDFGAIGDSETDDTEALNRAFTCLNTVYVDKPSCLSYCPYVAKKRHRGLPFRTCKEDESCPLKNFKPPLIIDPGVYVFTGVTDETPCRPLRVERNHTIVMGFGEMSAIWNQTKDIDTIELSASYINFRNFKLLGGRHAIVCSSSHPGYKADCLYFERMTIYGAARHGIYFEPISPGETINYSSYNRFFGCDFGVQGRAVDASEINLNATQFIGCIFEGNTAHPSEAGIVLGDFQAITILGCTFETIEQMIVGGRHQLQGGCYNILVEGCYFEAFQQAAIELGNLCLENSVTLTAISNYFRFPSVKCADDRQAKARAFLLTSAYGSLRDNSYNRSVVLQKPVEAANCGGLIVEDWLEAFMFGGELPKSILDSLGNAAYRPRNRYTIRTLDGSGSHDWQTDPNGLVFTELFPKNLNFFLPAKYGDYISQLGFTITGSQPSFNIVLEMQSPEFPNNKSYFESILEIDQTVFDADSSWCYSKNDEGNYVIDLEKSINSKTHPIGGIRVGDGKQYILRIQINGGCTKLFVPWIKGNLQ
jgi:hypothetical protein